MPIQLIKKLEVRNKEGKVIYTEIAPSESFVQQFLEVLKAYWTGLVNNMIGVTDTSNNPQTLPDANMLCSNAWNADGTVASVLRGIMVGTGVTAITNADYTMETLIAHGVGAGQLQYGATTHNNPTLVAGNIDFIFSRTFLNGSGGVITVEELGVITAVVETGGATKYFLMIHDLTGGVAVANGQTLTVTYTLRTTV